MVTKNLISPINDQSFTVEVSSSALDVGFVLQSARNATQVWNQMGFVGRGKLIRKVCIELEARRHEIAQIVRKETGKPLELALGEIDAAVDFGYLISAAGRAPIGTILPATSEAREVLVRRIPFGVAALLVSYNTPLPNYAWKTFPALLAGNTVILKPSEFTIQSALAFFDLFKKAGFPDGVFNLLIGGKDLGEKLVADEVDLVSFTGSHKGGIEIERASAGKLRKLILELGGNNPLIVFPDSDIDALMVHAISSAFSNAGQRCAAGSRILVHESLKDRFMKKFLSESAGLQVGTSSESNIGPLISSEAANSFEKFLHECEIQGARVERVGIKSSHWSSCAVLPAVIQGLNSESELSKKEIFGPAVRIYSFQTEIEAIQLANGTPYGLTAAIWTRDSELATRVSSALVCGLVNVNGPTYGAEFNFPFGGRKHSGNGTQDAGLESIQQYSTLKVISTYRN
jgi:alpha-ketoglutaric semialdehyde dehydrogenase